MAAVAGKRSRITDDQLIELVHQYERSALGSEVAAGATVATTIYPSNQTLTTLQVDRFNAMNAYMGRPLGNEIANRSQVVLTEVRDTMIWVMPQLMRIFAAKAPCRFEPQGEEDEKQAAVETDAVNYIFMTQNNGKLILHDFFWDALLLRNSYVGVYTREWKSVKEEKHTELDALELAQLLEDTADEKLEVLEQREYQIDIPVPLPQTGQPPQPGQMPPLMQPATVFDIKIRRTKNNKQVTVVCYPPEEMRVSPRATEGMERLPFTQHIGRKTRSELIQDGFSRDLIEGIEKARPAWIDIDALARDKVVDQLSIEDPSDVSMQELEVRTNVMMVDCDGDGVAELRRVILAGDKLIENEMIEETPFVSGAAMRMPHRHTGFSIYDLVMDLQVIKTTLMRAGLDNLTIANNMRWAVDWRNINMDDILTSRPYGPIRGNGPPGNWIMPIQPPTNVMSDVVPMLGYMDQVKTTRTGVGKGTMGLDADELHDVTKGGQLAAMSAAALIVELMAMMLAEGVKGIFSKIRSELIRNQDKTMQVKIRGKWVEINPSDWRADRTVTPNVGLGSGNREELRANVQVLMQSMEALVQAGLAVGPQQVFELFSLLADSLGFNNPERFALEPGTPEYVQFMLQKQQAAANAPQAPQVQAAKIRAQTTLIQQQAENQRAEAQAQVALTQAREQQIHEALQNAQQQVHEGLQGGGDRGLQILLALIKSYAQMISAEKGDPNELPGDVETAQEQLQ